MPCLLQIEATVLMHVNTVLKYDAALGPEWLKYLKGGGLQANTFMLQVRLASAVLQSFTIPLTCQAE